MRNKNKNNEITAGHLGHLKVLTLDIETCPIESYTWGTFQQDIGLEQIKTEWSVLSFAAKWLDSDKIIYHCTGGRGKHRIRDDKALLFELHKLLDKADIVIGQNAKAFDIKKVNARMLIHGLKPYSPIKVIDTLQEAKKFGFTSNKLAWLSKHLTPHCQKDKHEKYHGFELWLACLADKADAWKVMKKYNCQDILATEQVYLKLRPWMTNHPNITATSGRCPQCGSAHLIKKGWNYTRCYKVQQIQCKACSGYHMGQRVKLTRA